MPIIPHKTLETFGDQLFQAVGVPADQAAQASHHLVEANLVGHDSHGVIRVPNYVSALRRGSIKPIGDHTVVRETPAALTVNANNGFGIVMGYQAMQWAVDRAQQHTLGAVAVHQSSHIGRLGAFPPLAAEQDCIGILMLNGGSRFTAPFGGTARRLPPNPIAISVPTLAGPPLMLDMTTSMAAGGKVDVASARGKQLPAGWLVDAQGNSVTDPNLFRDGEVAMLPLGGELGYKGYGLAMMIDAIAGGLSWAGCSTAQPTRGGSGWLALAIKIESFIDINEYKAEVQKLIDWVKSSPTMPGTEKIYLPGELEEETRRQREAEGIFIEEKSWQALVATAEEAGIAVPEI